MQELKQLWNRFSLVVPKKGMTIMVIDVLQNCIIITFDQVLADWVLWTDLSSYTPFHRLARIKNARCHTCADGVAEYTYTVHQQQYAADGDLYDKFSAYRLCQTCLSYMLANGGRVPIYQSKDVRKLLKIPQHIGYLRRCGWKYSKSNKTFFRLTEEEFYGDYRQYGYTEDNDPNATPIVGQYMSALCEHDVCFFEKICNKTSLTQKNGVAESQADCLLPLDCIGKVNDLGFTDISEQTPGNVSGVKKRKE